MKKTTAVFLGICMIAGIILSGCAHVSYDKCTLDKEGKCTVQEDGKNAGIPFYEAKPCLMVVRSYDDKGNEKTTCSIVSLPDKTRKYYAKIENGWFGKADLSVTLQHGVLTTTTGKYQSDDTLTGLIGAAGTAAKVPAEIDVLAAEALVKLSEIAQTTYHLNDGDGSGSFLSGLLISKMEEAIENIQSCINEMEAEKESSGIQELKKLKSKMMQWTEKVKSDNAFNMRDKSMLFHEIVEKFLESAKKIRKSLKEIRGDLDHLSAQYSSNAGNGKCSDLKPAGAKMEVIYDTLSMFITEPKKEARVEIYEFVYSKSGELTGLKLLSDKPMNTE